MPMLCPLRFVYNELLYRERLKQKINLDIKTGQRTSLTAGANTEILSTGQHIETAAEIHMNGPQARTADSANSITDLHLHTALFNNPDMGWAKLRYQDGTIKSIMKRIPMHEPWALHENNSPATQKETFTDRELEE